MDSFDILTSGALPFPVLVIAFSPAVFVLLLIVYAAHLRLTSPSPKPEKLLALPTRANTFVYLNARSRKLVFSPTPLPSMQRKQPSQGTNKLRSILRSYRPPFEDLIEEFEV